MDRQTPGFAVALGTPEPKPPAELQSRQPPPREVSSYDLACMRDIERAIFERKISGSIDSIEYWLAQCSTVEGLHRFRRLMDSLPACETCGVARGAPIEMQTGRGPTS